MNRESCFTVFPTPATHNNPYCDLCGEFFTEGDTIFVGMIANGELVNVSECCRTSLQSVFSEREYWQPAEEESVA